MAQYEMPSTSKFHRNSSLNFLLVIWFHNLDISSPNKQIFKLCTNQNSKTHGLSKGVNWTQNIFHIYLSNLGFSTCICQTFADCLAFHHNTTSVQNSFNYHWFSSFSILYNIALINLNVGSSKGSSSCWIWTWI